MPAKTLVTNCSALLFCKFVVNENASCVYFKNLEETLICGDFVYFLGESHEKISLEIEFSSKSTILINWKLSISHFPRPSTPNPIFSRQQPRFNSLRRATTRNPARSVDGKKHFAVSSGVRIFHTLKTKMFIT